MTGLISVNVDVTHSNLYESRPIKISFKRDELLTKLTSQAMAKMRYCRGREGGNDETSAKTESTFAQALPLFWGLFIHRGL